MAAHRSTIKINVGGEKVMQVRPELFSVVGDNNFATQCARLQATGRELFVDYSPQVFEPLIEFLRLVQDSEPHMQAPVHVKSIYRLSWLRMMIANSFHPQVLRKAGITARELEKAAVPGFTLTELGGPGLVPLDRTVYCDVGGEKILQVKPELFNVVGDNKFASLCSVRWQHELQCAGRQFLLVDYSPQVFVPLIEFLRLVRDSEPHMQTPVPIDPEFRGSWIRMMIANSFHPQVLRKAGITIRELRESGCEAAFLGNAGFALRELVAMEDPFTLQDLFEAGYTPQELSVHYSALQLREAGCTIQDLLDAGCTPHDLHCAKFTARELKEAGLMLPQLRMAGFPLRDLKDAGFTPQQLLDGGFTLEQFLDFGFTMQQLLQGGFTPLQVLAVGHTFAEIRAEGLSPQQLLDGGLTFSHLREAGFSPEELRQAQLPLTELYEAGFSGEELRAGGFSPQEFLDASFTLQWLVSEGILSVQDLLQRGWTLRQLQGHGLTAQKLRLRGITLQQFLDGGFKPQELRAAGFQATELLKELIFEAGFTPKELREAGFTLQQLVNARLYPTAQQLHKGGWKLSQLQLEEAGFFCGQLRDAGFTARELLDAGFAIQQLQRGGFSGEQLLLQTWLTPPQFFQAVSGLF